MKDIKEFNTQGSGIVDEYLRKFNGEMSTLGGLRVKADNLRLAHSLSEQLVEEIMKLANLAVDNHGLAKDEVIEGAKKLVLDYMQKTIRSS